MLGPSREYVLTVISTRCGAEYRIAQAAVDELGEFASPRLVRLARSFQRLYETATERLEQLHRLDSPAG